MTIDLSDLVKAFGDDAAKREADYERMRKNFIEEKCKREKLERELKEAYGEVEKWRAEAAKLAQTRTVGNYEQALKAMPEGDLARDPRESLAWWKKQLESVAFGLANMTDPKEINSLRTQRDGILWQIKQAEERVYRYDESKGNQNGLLEVAPPKPRVTISEIRDQMARNFANYLDATGRGDMGDRYYNNRLDDFIKSLPSKA